MNLRPVLQIMRPANIITAIADVIAGIAISGFFMDFQFTKRSVFHITLLCISTSGLYGGGIVFNDIFDLKQDKINRPERVIPSGRLSLTSAIKLGAALLFIGVATAFYVSIFSGIIALAIAVSALIYDKFSKNYTFLGPINMGLCRGLNLILGMSIISNLEPKYYLIGILPILFISAITLTAQKETKGNNKLAITMAMTLDASIILGFYLISQHFYFSIKRAIVFLIIWYTVNSYAKLNAIINNNPKTIMKAVKIGILSLIPLNATYVAGFNSVILAVATLLLLPISVFLSKKFAVT